MLNAPKTLTILSVAAFFAAAGCTQQTHHDAGEQVKMCCPMCETITDAVAVISPTKGNTCAGTMHFTKETGGVHIFGQIQLSPNSVHALHVHEFGDLSSDDGSAAGGHYNPEGHHHGGPTAADHHAGDLGNITADASGVAQIDLHVTGLSICGMKDPILGRSVVIHAKIDDLTSQPAGNAGARIGVGVIGIAKSPATTQPK